MRPSVLLVDDDPDVRGVLRALMANDGGFEVVGEAVDGVAGVTMAADLHPDVVLLDLAMPVMDGLTVLPELRRVTPESKVVVLSAYGTDRTVHAAMEAGATAFVRKGAELATELVDVLHEVVAGPPLAQ